MINSFPKTYLVIIAVLEDGTMVRKFFGAHEKSTGLQKDAMNEKIRPYFNDAQFRWETMNTSQILFHFFNHEV